MSPVRALAFFVAALALSGAVGCSRTAPNQTADADAEGELPVLPLGGAFTLTDHNGQPFSLASLRGKVVLIFFGYTMCPDACPTTLSKLSSAYSRLTEEERAKVKALYITVDPARDTPAVLKDHLTYFGVDAIGLTGSPEDTARVAAQFGAHFEKSGAATAGGYLMAHTVSIFGLDAAGQTRLLIDYEASVDLVVRELRRLLDA